VGARCLRRLHKVDCGNSPARYSCRVFPRTA
jgi:hypothetical protein